MHGRNAKQSKTHFHCAGCVPGPHQVYGPLILPTDEVMERNPSFPVKSEGEINLRWHQDRKELYKGRLNRCATSHMDFFLHLRKSNLINCINFTCPMLWRWLVEWRCQGPQSDAFVLRHLYHEYSSTRTHIKVVMGRNRKRFLRTQKNVPCKSMPWSGLNTFLYKILYRF